MDSLGISASITGLVTSAGEVAKLLAPYVSTAPEAPSIAFQVNSEVQNTLTVLLAIEGLIKSIHSSPLRNASLVKIDHVVAVLTDGVLIFSDLESVAASGLTTDQGLRSRLRWTRKETTLSALADRLNGFNSSISLILNILQQ